MDMNSAGFDITLLNWLNHHLIPNSAPFLGAVSHLTTFISILSVLIVLMLWYVTGSRTTLKKFFILVSVLILVLIFSQGLKSLIYKDRPFDTYPFIEKLSDGGGSSFPSGHTMEAFAMATEFSLLFRRKEIVIPAFLWAVVVAYSRMALGVHYPSDVLGGCLIGIFLGWVVPWSFKRINFAGKTNS